MAEEADLNRPLEGTPPVWPPRGTYEPVNGPMAGVQEDGEMCEDETPASLGPAKERLGNPAVPLMPSLRAMREQSLRVGKTRFRPRKPARGVCVY